MFRNVSLLPGSRRSHASHAVGLQEPLVCKIEEDSVISWSMLEGRYPRYLPASNTMSALEMRSWVDLRPYVHFDPVTISDGALVSQAYRIFRSIGLRHLCAVDTSGDVTGILTRHDLVEAHVEKCWERERRDGSIDWELNWLPKPRHQRRGRAISAMA